MKKLSASVLAVDTKLLLRGFLSPGGRVIACPVNGQLSHGDHVLPGCAQTFSHGFLQRDSLPRHS